MHFHNKSLFWTLILFYLLFHRGFIVISTNKLLMNIYLSIFVGPITFYCFVIIVRYLMANFYSLFIYLLYKFFQLRAESAQLIFSIIFRPNILDRKSSGHQQDLKALKVSNAWNYNKWFWYFVRISVNVDNH